MIKSSHYRLITAVTLLLIAIFGLLWWRSIHSPSKHESSVGHKTSAVQPKPKKADPIVPAILAYNKGNYKAAEIEALRVIELSANSSDPKVKKDGVRARYIFAFSAARRKDMKLAPAGQNLPTLVHELAEAFMWCTRMSGFPADMEAALMAIFRAAAL